MIRGVNRRIVEITSTENDYFEKAVLYIRPEKTGYPKNKLDYEAKAYLNSIAPKKRRFFVDSIPLTAKLIAVAGVILFMTVMAYMFYYFI